MSTSPFARLWVLLCCVATASVVPVCRPVPGGARADGTRASLGAPSTKYAGTSCHSWCNLCVSRSDCGSAVGEGERMEAPGGQEEGKCSGEAYLGELLGGEEPGLKAQLAQVY